MEKTKLTQKEMWRVCDMAIRRMVDYGIEEYGEEDQKLFVKIQKIKKETQEDPKK